MAEKTAEEQEKERQEKQKEITPIETGKAINAPTNIQDLAKTNYERAEALAQEGKQPPPLPATSVNLASFQNQDNLPEDKRKPLQPVDIPGHPKAEERAQQSRENKQTADTRKGQAFGNVAATPGEIPAGAGEGGTLTDELLSGGNSGDDSGRTTTPTKTAADKKK